VNLNLKRSNILAIRNHVMQNDVTMANGANGKIGRFVR